MANSAREWRKEIQRIFHGLHELRCRCTFSLVTGATWDHEHGEQAFDKGHDSIDRLGDSMEDWAIAVREGEPSMAELGNIVAAVSMPVETMGFAHMSAAHALQRACADALDYSDCVNQAWSNEIQEMVKRFYREVCTTRELLRLRIYAESEITRAVHARLLRAGDGDDFLEPLGSNHLKLLRQAAADGVIKNNAVKADVGIKPGDPFKKACELLREHGLLRLTHEGARAWCLTDRGQDCIRERYGKS